MYPMLVGAGFGKKKIEFSSSDKHDDAVKRITDVYPRLAKCGGFTLHKSQDGGTIMTYDDVINSFTDTWHI